MNTTTMILSAPILAMATFHTASAQRFAVDINHTAPVKCEKSIVIAATPEQVWDVMTAIDQWPSWQTDIAKAQLHGTLSVGASFTWKTGGAKIRSKVHTVEKATAFGWTGKTVGMHAVHNWHLEEVSGGTRVTVTESLDGFLASLLKKSFNKNLERGMQTWLELLKKEVERRG